jgi:tetratricopeptide (TPR) repeat protein
MLIAFGKYLKIVRDRRKLSLSDVATLTKSYPEPIGKGYLSRVERGLARVGFSKMIALSRAYEVPLDAFGEKLSLDLEVDSLKNAPNTSGKTFGELMELAGHLSERGMKLHFYAAVRDALPRAALDPPAPVNRTQQEQIIRAALSHGVTARSNGRYYLALSEFAFVLHHVDVLEPEYLSIVYEQSAVVRLRLGELENAATLAEQAVAIASSAPQQKYLGDAFDTRANVASRAKLYESAISDHQRAFTAYKAAGRLMDCARAMNNLALSYFGARRFKAAARASMTANKLASKIGADAVRSRSRLMLGDLAALDGDLKRASALWHDALEIARRTRESVVIFDAEFRLFKLSIQQANPTVTQALGRRLNRMTPWIPHGEAEIEEFLRLYAIHRKPKQRGVAGAQLGDFAASNPTRPSRL